MRHPCIEFYELELFIHCKFNENKKKNLDNGVQSTTPDFGRLFLFYRDSFGSECFLGYENMTNQANSMLSEIRENIGLRPAFLPLYFKWRNQLIASTQTRRESTYQETINRMDSIIEGGEEKIIKWEIHWRSLLFTRVRSICEQFGMQK